MWQVNGAPVQCKVTSMNGNGQNGQNGMGQMGQAGGGLNNPINMGPVGGGMMGGMGMGMGMGGGMDQMFFGDLGMVQDGNKCGNNMVN